MVPYFSDWSQRKFKVHFFQADLASPYRPRFKGIIICGSDVPKILCLQHPGIVANWIDFKPPFQNNVHSSLGCLLFAAIYLIYTKRINPKFATESECNHIYVSFSMRMLLSDIWSRSNFWVTVHASWVLIDPLTHLQTESVTFVANVGFIR